MKTNRREFLALSAGALAAEAVARASDAPPARPNILVILTDQQRADMLGCAGNRWVQTPNMDNLAAQGTRFERAYCGNPVCLPSRFSMFTGLLPSVNGIEQNEKPPSVSEGILRSSLGQLFRQGGYQTVYGGKTHLPPPARASTAPAGKPGPGRGMAAYGFDQYITANEREDLARLGADFLRAPHDRPFLLVASLINPHDICFMAINDYAARDRADRESFYRTFASNVLVNQGVKAKPMTDRQAFAPGELERFVRDACPPLPDNFEIPAGEPEGLETLDWRPFRPYVRRHWGADQWRLHRWAYARLTERVDKEIGVLLEGLRQGGREKDTLVVMLSDHGDMDASHRLEHKSMLYEEAVHVPLIVSWKGVIPAGAVDRGHLVSTGLDLLPTLCDFAGIAAPPGRAGRSLRPLALGQPAGPWRQALVVENEKSRLVRWAGHKYIVYAAGKDREQLIDLDQDPGEMKNLARDPACRDRLLEGRHLLAQWYQDHHMKLDTAYVVR